jgi:hypothetical protein
MTNLKLHRGALAGVLLGAFGAALFIDNYFSKAGTAE